MGPMPGLVADRCLRGTRDSGEDHPQEARGTPQGHRNERRGDAPPKARIGRRSATSPSEGRIALEARADEVDSPDNENAACKIGGRKPSGGILARSFAPSNNLLSQPSHGRREWAHWATFGSQRQSHLFQLLPTSPPPRGFLPQGMGGRSTSIYPGALAIGSTWISD